MSCVFDGILIWQNMCDARYHLYWWETEPYLERADDSDDNAEPRSQFGLKGMMFDTVNELFLVRLLINFTTEVGSLVAVIAVIIVPSNAGVLQEEVRRPGRQRVSLQHHEGDDKRIPHKGCAVLLVSVFLEVN